MRRDHIIQMALCFRKCLESKKILSEFKERIKSQATHSIKGTRNLYTYSEIQSKKSYDDVFLATSWPWILRPNSEFVTVWNTCVLLVVYYVAIVFPYFAAFKHADELNRIVATQAVFLVYLFDIVVQSCTAIESKTEMLSRISDIVNARMEKMTFIADILAAVPFHLHSVFITPTGIFGRILTFLSLNRLLKLYKIDISIRDFERTTKVPIGVVKAARCTLYVAYLGYICGAFYYSLSCFESAKCYKNSWVPYLRSKIEEAQTEKENLINTSENIWAISFRDLLGVITNRSPSITISVIEHIAQCVISVIGVVVVNYLFAEYTAALMLKYNSTMYYLEFFYAIRRLMFHDGMPKELRTRVFNQLKTNWRVNEGVKRQTLYVDCPQRLYDILQVSIYANLLVSSPLFQGISDEILNLIATKCTELHLPPNEFLVYSGEQVQNIYVIMRGFCMVMEGIHGKKVLGPNSLISGIEACLELPSAITVCACTYIKVVKFTCKDFKYITIKYPEFEEAIKKSVNEEAVGQVFYRISEHNETSTIKPIDDEEESFFIFPNYRRHPLNIDYKQAYKDTGWKIVSQAAKTIPFMLVVLSTFSTLLMYVSSENGIKNGRYVMVPSNYSWVALSNGMDHLDITEPSVFLLVSFYYNACLFLGANFNQYQTWTTAEVVLVNFCIICGYVFKIYIAVGIVHSRYVGNHELIVHTNNMLQLLNYFAEEKIPKALQKKVAEHFIQTWNMTYGFPKKTIISAFHLPLKTEFCLHWYLGTLSKVAVFEDAGMGFFRHIAYHLDEVFLKRDHDVIKVNDIVNAIFIVHKGEITIYSPTGGAFAVLREGGMFGNLDNIHCTRSMVRATTTMTTDLLVVNTTEFYNVLQHGYSFVHKKIQNFLLLQNFSYIRSSEETKTSEIDEEFAIRLSLVNKVVSNSFWKFGMIAAGISSCLLSSYQASYMKLNKFYLDAISIFPYEIFCLLVRNDKERELYRKYLGVPRILRALNVFQYFSGYDFLSNTIICLRLLLNLTYILVLVHIGACLFHVIACPDGNCKSNYWVKKEGSFQCGQEYLCSIYMMMSILSLTAYPTSRIPRSLADISICIVTLVLSEFTLVLLLADLAVLLRNAVYSLTKYDFEMKEFVTYLENSFVSVPFLQNMQRYCNNLWTAGKGRQVPSMLISCPGHLQEEIKVQAYGYHIFNNVVFANCHPDFLRAVIRELKIQKFFLGDTICHQEDVNDTMYFIHKGSVDVYSLTETEEVHVDTLLELDCFGMTELNRTRGKDGRLQDTQRSVELRGESKKIDRTSKKEMARPKLKVVADSEHHTCSKKKTLFKRTRTQLL
ncbi:hypothetical protein Trydic_g11138 [Trypoxylus dichotomus]